MISKREMEQIQFQTQRKAQNMLAEVMSDLNGVRNGAN